MYSEVLTRLTDFYLESLRGIWKRNFQENPLSRENEKHEKLEINFGSDNNFVVDGFNFLDENGV